MLIIKDTRTHNSFNDTSDTQILMGIKKISGTKNSFNLVLYDLVKAFEILLHIKTAENAIPTMTLTTSYQE